ncbi:MAG TPA: hypothetical protein DDW30_09790 [Clostridiales bacterium]|nr:hypothetical protein [Clostridiales bacterium]
MKKLLKTALPIALLLAVLVTAFAVGASAKTVDNTVYYGVYATTPPTIDGEIDEVWNDAPEMAFGNASNGYIKVMWDGTTAQGTLYLLAVVNGCEEVDFVISAQFHSNTSAPWSWGGNYGFNINANTDSKAAGYVAKTKADFLTRTSQNAIIKAKATETGFVAEVAFTLTADRAQGFTHGGFYGIGAFVNGDYTIAENSVGMDIDNIKDSSGYIYGIYLHGKVLPATGEKERSCADCGKELPARHSAEAVWVKTDDENHHLYYPCCETSEADVPHEWSAEKIIDKAATCTEAGEDSFHCAKCGARKEVRTLDALGHEFSETYTEDKAATCTEAGEESRHCSRCDETTGAREIPALGHEYSTDFTVVKEPDCVNTGYQTHKCIRCDEGLEGVDIPAKGHDMVETERKDPDCVNKGYEPSHCQREGCDKGWIPALGHDFAEDYTVDKQPTCTKAGSASHHCSRCNATDGQIEVAPRGHIPGDWIIDVPVTNVKGQTTDGKRHRDCKVCGATIGRSGIHYGVREEIEPDIDGNIDAVWADAPELWFGNSEYGYIKVMSCGNALYLLAVINGCEQVDLIVSTLFYNSVGDKTWTWPGNYGLNIKVDTDSSAEGYVATTTASFLTADQAAQNAIVKARATENGFVAEVKLPLSGRYAAGCKLGGMFGIGAFVNSEYTEASTVGFDVANMKTASGYIYATYMGCPHKNLKPETAKCTGTTCADCNKVNENATDLTKHAKSPVWKTDETDPGKCYLYYPCCGLKEEAVEHEWNEKKTDDKKATCTEAGEKSTHCKHCGASKGDTEAVEPLGHNWSESYTVDKAATCTEKGSESHHCTRCGIGGEGSREIDALDHDWSDVYSIDKAPTCAENGSMSYHCKRCDATKDAVELTALGHEFAEKFTVDSEADCEHDGAKSRHCLRDGCDAVKDTEVLPKLGHDFAEDYTLDKAATCTESGSESRHCSRCDAVTDTRELPALGHDIGDWEVVKEATCKAAGTRHKTCSRCWMESETETIPALPHTASDEWIVDKEAAPGVAGKRHHVCMVCGQSFDEEEIPALPAEEETAAPAPDNGESKNRYAVVGCKGSLSATVGTVGVLLLPFALIACGKRRKEKDPE